MLVLPVGLSVVANDPIAIGHRGCPHIATCNLSVQSVVKSLEQTFSQVHISNWVNRLIEDHASRQLSIPLAPVVLNTFKMPLVDHSNDLLGIRPVDINEQSFVSFVDEDVLKLREENFCARYIPVD